MTQSTNGTTDGTGTVGTTDGTDTAGGAAAGDGGRRPLMAFAWVWVGVPFAYGVYELVLKMKQLFVG
ncbi:MFS transporter small subunit [Streptomyces zingiberis]|uniref:Uncharacterized protein n=1 Tax=Streptomyces zingiberis TaxID=2053010 RepID=A0ABX1BUI1_9ACTN|nr:hypothetical protein [Streptomyces zingiberis]NJP99021.1 hypothetical protein [Streptomyces zingiberis]